ncbi:MAG: hypothetical protein ABW067_14535 [Rhizobacter sp.]
MSHVSTSSGSLSFLRKVLFADAAISAACGALMAFGGSPLQGLLGLPAAMLAPAGLSLFVYAAFVAWLARRPVVPRAGVWAAVVINLVWAVDCLAVAFGPWFAPTGLGQAFLVVQVVTVVAFAELQVMGLKRG